MQIPRKRYTRSHTRAHTHTGEASKEGRMWVVGWGETGRGLLKVRTKPLEPDRVADEETGSPIPGVAAVTARRVLLRSRERCDCLGASGKDEAVEMQLLRHVYTVYPDEMAGCPGSSDLRL